MAKVWKEVFTERLCDGLRWLTESNTLQVTIADNYCYFQLSENSIPISARVIHQVLCAIPLTPGLTKKRVRGLEKIKTMSGRSRSPRADCTYICDRFNCKYCQDRAFFCSSKYTHLSVGMKNLETIVALVTGIFPLQIDSTLVIGALCGLMTPPFNVTQPEFHHLLCHFTTLRFTLAGFTWNEDVGYPRKFLYTLLGSLTSNPQSRLQNLHLCLCSSDRAMIDYYEIIMDSILSFFSLSKSSDVTPFLHLKGLHVEVRAVKEDVEKIIAIITDQVELERLQISPIFSPRKCRTFVYDALFKAVERCFHRPTFHCLIIKNFHLTTATVLDVLQEFLVSTACQDQQFMLKNVTIDSSNVKRSISYASDSKVCRKSLSVEGCSVTNEGIFSTADIASGILLHPGIKSVGMTHSLNCMDFYKLTAALERGTGTLQFLNLSGHDLSSIIVKAGSFFCALFHLPYLSELELVLKSCNLNVGDFDQLYLLWEKESSGKKRRGQSLRKLCVCGNVLPEDKSNLEMMVRSLCC